MVDSTPIPGSLGANPFVTVTVIALAERNMTRIRAGTSPPGPDPPDGPRLAADAG